jgi:Asp-tRNA(Asn)/Glu-tRNA(Gln) amidotransferase A subunit family amidase
VGWGDGFCLARARAWRTGNWTIVAGLTEVLIPAGYVTTVYDPVFALSPEGMRYVSVAADTPTTIPSPGLPFSLVFHAEPGKEDIVLRIASAYEAASQRRVPPPAFGPLSAK